MSSVRRRDIVRWGIVTGLGAVGGCLDSSDSRPETSAWDNQSGSSAHANWLPNTTVDLAHTDFTAYSSRTDRTEFAENLDIEPEAIEAFTKYTLTDGISGSVLLGDFDPESFLNRSERSDFEERTYRGFRARVTSGRGTIGANEEMVVGDASEGTFELIVDTYHDDEPSLFDESDTATTVLSAVGSAPVTHWIDTTSLDEHLFSGVSAIDSTQVTIDSTQIAIARNTDSGILATHLRGEIDEDVIGRIETLLGGDHRETDGEIVTFDVADSGELSIREPEGVRNVVPQLEFFTDETAETVVFTHAGGDSIDAPNRTLSLLGPVQNLGTGDSYLETEDDSELTVGDRIHADLEAGAESGDEIRLLWSPQENSETSTLVTYVLAGQ
jgi:hypothetical protein